MSHYRFGQLSEPEHGTYHSKAEQPITGVQADSRKSPLQERCIDDRRPEQEHQQDSGEQLLVREHPHERLAQYPGNRQVVRCYAILLNGRGAHLVVFFTPTASNRSSLLGRTTLYMARLRAQYLGHCSARFPPQCAFFLPGIVSMIDRIAMATMNTLSISAIIAAPRTARLSWRP